MTMAMCQPLSSMTRITLLRSALFSPQHVLSNNVLILLTDTSATICFGCKFHFLSAFGSTLVDFTLNDNGDHLMQLCAGTKLGVVNSDTQEN